jgi:hypothetical protein
MVDDPSMRHDLRLHALLAVVVAVLAGGAVRAGATLAPPKQTPCGDIVGGAWTVRDRESGTGLTGSHYTVVAINFPCAKARTYVAKLTRRRSLGPGPTALLPGFMCITGLPKGFQLQHGGCSVGTSPVLMPTAAVKSFKWQACAAVMARRAHLSCTTRKL